MSFGGTQGHVAKLAPALARAGFDVRLYCLEEKGVLGEELERSGIPVTALGLRRLYGARSCISLLRVARTLRREKVSIVQSFLTSGRIFGTLAARLAGVPVVACGIRGEAVVFHQRRHRFFRRLTNRYSDLFLANSDAMKRKFIEAEGVEENRVAVIRNGVDLERFRSSIPTAAARERLGIAVEGRVVGYAGSLIPVKRVDVFLRAAGLVAETVPDARFLVVGSALSHVDPGMGEKLRAQAEDMGIASRVIFLDFQKEIHLAYSAMDLLVLPSESEGMSNTLLEAMAVSLPVVASDLPENREVVADGRNGYLFPVGDHRVLAEKIIAVLDDPGLAARFGEESRRLVEQSFGLKGMVAATADAYRAALSGKDFVTGYFDRKARQFDSIYSGEKSKLGRFLDRILRWDMVERMRITLAAASETGAASILDVGCGSGRIAIPLALRTSARVVGIDTSPRMVEMAGVAASAAGVSERCEFRVGDVFAVDADERYEMSIAIGLFDYIFEPLPILERMALLTDGTVVASFPKRNARAVIRKVRLKICGCPVRFFTERETRGLFERAGMEIDDFRSVGNLYVVTAKKADRAGHALHPAADVSVQSGA